MADVRVEMTLHAFDADPVNINQYAFDKWLQGLSVEETARARYIHLVGRGMHDAPQLSIPSGSSGLAAIIDPSPVHHPSLQSSSSAQLSRRSSTSSPKMASLKESIIPPAISQASSSAAAPILQPPSHPYYSSMFLPQSNIDISVQDRGLFSYIFQDTADQYRVFEELQRYLYRPCRGDLLYASTFSPFNLPSPSSVVPPPVVIPPSSNAPTPRLSPVAPAGQHQPSHTIHPVSDPLVHVSVPLPSSQREYNFQFQLPNDILRSLVTKYYSFDDRVLREFLGKKLYSKQRKGLDDVHERTGLSLHSIRIQFQNVKRIYAFVEELLESCEKEEIPIQAPLVTIIQREFLLSEELARKYFRVVFLCWHKFETAKKKISIMDFEDFCHCAGEMMANWTNPSDVRGLELDTAFTESLKRVKSVLNERDIIDQYRHQARADLGSSFSYERLSRLDDKFSTIFKGLLNVASDIGQPKELKDFFIDLVEKVGDTLVRLDLSQDGVQRFFDCLITGFDTLSLSMAAKIEFGNNWQRFLLVVCNCLLRIYPKLLEK